jgi:hypothetical protein
MDDKDIAQRLQALEEENRRLRRAAGIKPLETTVYTSIWKDQPILTFETATGRPFSFGVKKAMTILDKIEDIKKFVEVNKHTLIKDDESPPHAL